MKLTLSICPALIALMLTGCVNVDPNTGKTIPGEIKNMNMPT